MNAQLLQGLMSTRNIVRRQCGGLSVQEKIRSVLGERRRLKRGEGVCAASKKARKIATQYATSPAPAHAIRFRSKRRQQVCARQRSRARRAAQRQLVQSCAS